MVSASGRGALLVLEGCDRCGKSTQAYMLFKELSKSVKAELLHFPDRTTSSGKIIDSYLRKEKSLSDEEIHQLFSQNRFEQDKKIRDLISNGTTLIIDRYTYSGVAFSVAKGLNFEWCKSTDVGLPKPDLVMFLDFDPLLARARAGYGDERYENIEMQCKVRKIYLEQLFDSENWKVFDASKSIAHVFQELLSAALKTIEDCKYLSLKNL